MYHPRQARRAVRFIAAVLLAMSLLPAWAANLPDPTAFRVRMEVGDIAQAREWLAAGLNPNFQGDRIGTGLMIAAWEGNVPLMEVFAARGADVNATNKLGETALMHAAWKGRMEAVRWLLAHGAKVDREAMQWTALHYAAFAGQTEVADLLIDRGADVNARSPNGSSVLMMAVYEGKEDLAKRLLARGADTSIKNENGDGALEWAMKFDHQKIARMVSTPQAYRAAANRPKSDWGQARRSDSATPEIEELLRIREILASRNMAAVDQVDRRIAAMRAKQARESMKRQEVREIVRRPDVPEVAKRPVPVPTMQVLEITAERRAPSKQEMRMLTVPVGQ
jgi:hypothetical protein